MEETDFIERLYAAFAAAPRPLPDEITPHRCWECDEVRDRLGRYEARDVPVGDMEWVGDSLPLLGPKALRYYLPRYLEFSITHRSSNACEFVLYHLADENPNEEYWMQRYEVFSDLEREAIVQYLSYRATWPDAQFEEEWVQRGLSYWRRDAEQAHAGDARNARA